MNTVSRFRKGLERFRGYVEKAGRNPADIEVALRVLAGPGGKPRAALGQSTAWTGTWGVTPQSGGQSFGQQTIRQIVYTSIGGSSARIRSGS